MKILIKGDRNVGKSCLLQRLQGGPFIEEYVPTDQIQVAPIHWTYKNTDYIVKVEVWEVVDKGRTKKKPPIGLKFENQSSTSLPDDAIDAPVLDATFLDVYKNATGVILMLDITKPWTFDYVVKELSQVPDDLPVVVLGNHCDMQHHRQVHSHHIEQALQHAKLTRTAPVRYAESSMRNGFGLRLLHKFLSVPFLRLQRTSLLEQLQRNQKDSEEAENELDEFQNSEEAHYNQFVDRLANKRRQNSQPELRPNERSPSIVLGAGKPIVPPNVNPLLAQSLNLNTVKMPETPVKQNVFVSAELMTPKSTVDVNVSKPPPPPKDRDPGTPQSGTATTASSGALDEFYAGTLDSSFLEDLTPLNTTKQEELFDSESDDDAMNPKVFVDQDDFDVDVNLINEISSDIHVEENIVRPVQEINILLDDTVNVNIGRISIQNETIESSSHERKKSISDGKQSDIDMQLENEFPLWAGDSSARRSPEGGEDPDVIKESTEKMEKKHKKKKSKNKDRGDSAEKSEYKEKKHKHKKLKSEKQLSNPQQSLLTPTFPEFNYEEYDSI